MVYCCRNCLSTPPELYLGLAVPCTSLLTKTCTDIRLDSLNPTCPGCGWVDFQPWYVGVCNTAVVSCLKCGLEHCNS